MPHLPLQIKTQIPTLKVKQAIDLLNEVVQSLDMEIIGEVANYSVSKGKWIYFDLKDEEVEARLSCFMTVYGQSQPIENGMRVKVSGRFNIYEKTGDFKIIVSKVAPEGEGSLRKAFELLKKKLELEGLFKVERKRQLPLFPTKVGLLTSKDGAALGDFLKIANLRFKGIKYYIYNIAVQGEMAESEIERGFNYFNEKAEVEVIALMRGGGSQEDLHAFNSELVARAIVRSKIPVVVGVGHERDLTIADFCADLRAATPSNAAQLIVPSFDELNLDLQKGLHQIKGLLASRINGLKNRVTLICREQANILRQNIQKKQFLVESILKNISALSPERILEKGYALVYNENGDLLKNVQEIQEKQITKTYLIGGHLKSKVLEIKNN